MKLSLLLLFVLSAFAFAQTPPPAPTTDQIIFQRKQASGPYWLYGVTPVADKVFGWDGTKVVMTTGGGGGSAVWGGITGTLSAQLDLQAALDALQPKTGVLALGGFSSITGTLPAANVADLSATYLTVTTAGSTYTPLTRSIATQHSLTGGGDLSSNRTLNLVNDTASPGNSQYYGTDAGGTRGWFSLPASNPGTVTNVSVVTANGISGSVANATSTPAITLTLGAISPSSVNGVTLSGSSSPALTVTGTTSVSGTNTGDQTTITGNAGSATVLQTGRTIAITGDIAYTSPAFDGSGNVTAAGTLTTVNSNVGTFGALTSFPIVTVNAKGLVTAVTTSPLGNLALISTLPPSLISYSAANRLAGSSMSGPFVTGVEITVSSPLSLSSGVLSLPDGSLSNAKLANSSITIGGASTALGGTVTASTILDSIGSTRGSILERGASGWAAITPGTNGYVLTSNGSGADPSWQAPPGGSPGGSSGQLQYNNGGSFAGMTGSSVSGVDIAFSGTILTGGSASQVAIGANQINGLWFNIGGLVFTSGGTNKFFLQDASSRGMVFASDLPMSWATSSSATATAPDVGLQRQGGYTLGVVNPNSNNQPVVFEVDNTFTSSTNKEVFSISWNAVSNEAWVGMVKGSGGGSARDVVLHRDGVEKIRLNSTGTAIKGDVQLDKTITSTGTTGAQTINKTSGSVNFAAAATSLVVTNSLVTANSIIICTVATNDATMLSVRVVAGSGSFTIYANAAATAETRVNFIITN